MYKKSTTKITIEDIIEAAKSADIKCENCKYYSLEQVFDGKCNLESNEDRFIAVEPQYPKSHFCSEFKPKK